MLKAHETYKKDCASNGAEKTYSFRRFCHLCREWGVKPINYDQYSCPHCFRIDIGDKDPKLTEHTTLINNGVSCYRHSINALPNEPVPPSEIKNVVIMIDYARIHELGTPKGEKKKLSVFNITVVLDRQTQYCYDFMSCSKQGWTFMSSAFQEFVPMLANLQIPKSAKITIWSDGGLRNYGTLEVINRFQRKIENCISLRFYPSYHGHSRCDAHFGQGKLSLRKGYPTGGLVSSQQVQEVFTKLKNTTAAILDTESLEQFDEESSWDVQDWKSKGQGVKSWQLFKFDGTGGIKVSDVLQNGRYRHMPTPIRKVQLPNSEVNQPTNSPAASVPSFDSSITTNNATTTDSASPQMVPEEQPRPPIDFSGFAGPLVPNPHGSQFLHTYRVGDTMIFNSRENSDAQNQETHL